MAEKAKESGTSFQSRAEATNQFKQKYADKYTAKYDAEPAKRPDYIPQQTTINNNHYTVVYDRTNHGYGYYEGTRWRAYDPLLDAIVLADLMTRHSYYAPPPPIYTAPAPTYYGDQQSVFVSGSGWSVLGIVLVSFLVLAAVGFVIVNEIRRGAIPPFRVG